MRLRKLYILRRQGSIAKHLDLRAGTRIGIVYAHNIESPLARWWKPPEVLSCHRGHLAPFVPVHRRLWSLHIARGPRLNFNETKHIRIPSDQVDFPAAARRTKIARHHLIPQLSQMEVRVLLPMRAGPLMPRPRVSRKHPPRNPIQAVNDRSRETGGQHERYRAAL